MLSVTCKLIMLSVIVLSVIMLSVIMPCVIIPSVIIPSVIMLNVVAPKYEMQIIGMGIRKVPETLGLYL
jgi:hypothetical protein